MADRLRPKGFTVIEILVVIGIIGVLTTIASVGSMRAREKAKEAKAQEDLSVIRTAVAMLVQDTGKWPNGCPVDSDFFQPVDLGSVQAGLLERPAPDVQEDGCFWSEGDVSRWNGPYATFRNDPWGNDYTLRSGYEPFGSCPSREARSAQAALVSMGPDGGDGAGEGCDDLWLGLR